MMWNQNVYFSIGIPVALWICVVKFETFVMPVNVIVDDSTEVVDAVPGKPLKEIKPNAGSSPYPTGRQPEGG
jgi:hypothetical protein